MKYKKLNIIVLFITIALILYITLKDDFSGTLKVLNSANKLIILLAILVFLLSYFIKSLSLNILLKNKYKQSIKNTYFLTLIGQFVNGITPFQSGGQPYEIYLLRKNNVRITDSASALIKDFISYQIALMTIGILSLIINKYSNILNNTIQINILIYCGILINGFILMFLLFVCFSKNITKKIIKKLYGIKIINKNKDKINEAIENFYESGMELKKNKVLFIKCIIINLCHLIVLYIIPYIVFKSFSIDTLSIKDSIIATTFVMLVGNFVPTPGATGGMEYSFIQFFSNFGSVKMLPGIMLTWRFVTYFVSLLIGFTILIIMKGIDRK